MRSFPILSLPKVLGQGKGYTLALLLFLCGLPGPADARQWDPPPISQTEQVQPTESVAIASMPAIDPGGLIAEDEAAEQRRLRAPSQQPPGQPHPPKNLSPSAPEAPASPLRMALPMTVDFTPLNSGTWEDVPDGGQLWRLRLKAPGATDLNFGFTEFHLVPGARFYIISESEDYYQGPYTADDNKEHGQLWTPLIPGNQALIELYLPPDPDPTWALHLTKVNRGYRDLFHSKAGSLAKAGNLAKAGHDSCEAAVDVACNVASPWRNQVRSVGKFTVSGTTMCTGTLVMDTSQSFRPYFLTAHHCRVNTDNASSVVVFWNFESPACGNLGFGSLDQNQSGATLVASRADVDFARLELDDEPNPEFDVFYSGWDATGMAPVGSVGIHHPGGQEKAISLNQDALMTGDNPLFYVEGIDTHWIVDNWELGTTGTGSSGSCLWDPATNQCVGILSGGEASCLNERGFDGYGKLSQAWEGGAGPTSQLKDWLDPENTGALMIEGSDKPPPRIDPDQFANRPKFHMSRGYSEHNGGEMRRGFSVKVGQLMAATKESSEPPHADGMGGGHSLWWEMKARTDGMARLVYSGEHDFANLV